jgi:hypothetical protein
MGPSDSAASVKILSRFAFETDTDRTPVPILAGIVEAAEPPPSGPMSVL